MYRHLNKVLNITYWLLPLVKHSPKVRDHYQLPCCTNHRQVVKGGAKVCVAGLILCADTRPSVHLVKIATNYGFLVLFTLNLSFPQLDHIYFLYSTWVQLLLRQHFLWTPLQGSFVHTIELNLCWSLRYRLGGIWILNVNLLIRDKLKLKLLLYNYHINSDYLLCIISPSKDLYKQRFFTEEFR